MSRESRLSFKNQGALPQTLQALVWSELCFAKWLRHRIMVMTFVNESCLWQPHRLVRSVGQSILLRKTVYCQNFATQNRLQRQRSSLFLTAPFFFGVHTLRFIVQNFASQSGYATASIFAVHKRLDLNFEQSYCQYFAI